MTDIIGGILVGPEVDNYHHVSNDFTSTEDEVKYVNELTKLLTGIGIEHLNTYLVKVKGDIKKEPTDINEGDEVVAKLVADETNIDLSSHYLIYYLKSSQNLQQEKLQHQRQME